MLIHSFVSTESIPYFVGKECVPNFSCIITILNLLITQWMSELCIFFAPKTIKIYVYPMADKEFGLFWAEPWAKSLMPMINKIILVTHSVSQLFLLYLDIRPRC